MVVVDSGAGSALFGQLGVPPQAGFGRDLWVFPLVWLSRPMRPPCINRLNSLFWSYIV